MFYTDADYRAFIELLASGVERYPVKILAFSVLPNHFHAVVQPAGRSDLSALMQWWLTSHVRRYHHHYGSTGHVWQGRFKSFPIEQDDRFLTVVRYVLRNPVRAGLVEHPGCWPWSSLHYPGLIGCWPVPPPPDFDAWLQQPMFDAELERVRSSVNPQAPFGSPGWRLATARAAGSESSLRPRGRPGNKSPR